LRLFSFGGYGLALAALALVVFGAIEYPPSTNRYSFLSNRALNPLPPSDDVRQQKKTILEDLFSSVLSQFKKYYTSGNLKLVNVGILKSLKFRILMGEVLPICLKLNFTRNIFGC